MNKKLIALATASATFAPAVMAQTANFVNIGQNKNGAVSTALQPESKLGAVGYNYDFSKRTTFMMRYASLKNNAASNASLSGSDLLTFAVNNDPQGFGAGLRHTF